MSLKKDSSDVVSSNKKKSGTRRLILTGVLGLAVAATAITLPLVLKSQKNINFDINYSENSFVGNRNRITKFIEEIKKDNSSLVTKSIKVVGKNGLIGEDNIDLSSNNRSMITINQALENDLFKDNFSSRFNYQLYTRKLDAKIAYIIPNPTNSTYPLVGIELYSGEGENYYSEILEYPENSLYGFKVDNNEANLSIVNEAIKKDGAKYFTLKEEVGKIGEAGIFAKNIKAENFDFENNEAIKELKKQNIFVNLSSITADKFIPSNLSISYQITYNDGISYYKKDFQTTVLTGFQVEQGVDDPVWKVKKFIKDNKESFLDNLYQYFTYTPAKGTDDKPIKKTVKEANNAGLFTFKENDSSVISTLNSNGITLEYVEAVPSLYDSTTPSFKVNVISYDGTPNQYSESVLIEGRDQQGEFNPSEEEEDLKIFQNRYNNDPFFDWNDYFKVDTTKIKINDEFLNIFKGTGEGGAALKIQDFPYEIVKEVYENEVLTNNNINALPFELQFERLTNKTGNADFDNAVTTIIDSTNALLLDPKIAKEIVHFKEKTIEVNYGIANVLSTWTPPSTTISNTILDVIPVSFDVSVFGFNKSLEEWNKDKIKVVAKGVTMANTNIFFKDNITSSSQIAELVKQRKWKEIFKSVTLKTYPPGLSNLPHVVGYDDSYPSLEIDYGYFNETPYNEIGELNKLIEDISGNDNKFDINLQIKVSRNGFSEVIELKKFQLTIPSPATGAFKK